MRQGGWSWACWITGLATSVAFVVQFGRNLPYSDEWTNFTHLVGEEPISLAWLWEPLNEQRIPLARLLYVGIVRASGDVRTVMIINACGLAAAAALLMAAARRLRGRSTALDAVFPVLLLAPAHYENLLSALQISFVASAALTCAAIFVLVAAPDTPSDRRTLAVGALAALLPLTGGTGLLPALGLLAWLLAVLVARRGHGVSTAALAVGAAPALAYLAASHHPPSTPPYRLAALPRALIEVASTAFGVSDVAPMMLGTIALLLAGAGLLALRRSSVDRWQRGGILAATIGMLILLAGIAYGRGMYGPGAALVPRYTSVSALLLACAALSFACLEAARWARVLSGLLLAGLVGLLPFNTRAALQYASIRSTHADLLARDVADGLPIWRLVAHHGVAVFDYEGREVPHLLRLMARHRFGYYRGAPSPAPDPQIWDERPLDLGAPIHSHDATWNEGEVRAIGPDPYVVYAITPAQHIAALRLELVLEQPKPQIETLELHVWWAVASAGEDFRPETRNVAYFLPSVGDTRHALMFFVDARIDRLRIDPDFEHARFRLLRAVVLTPRVSRDQG